METIIIQELDQDVRDVLKIALESQGFDIITIADDYARLIEMIRTTVPALVLVDFKTNGQAAIQICKQLKSMYACLPIIALSCNENISSLYAKYSFDDYIKKPFDLDKLFRIIRHNLMTPGNMQDTDMYSPVS